MLSLQICESKLKPMYLVDLLQNLGGEKCIVFTSSVESTHRLCTLLNFFDDLQIKIMEYSGLQRQSVRRWILVLILLLSDIHVKLPKQYSSQWKWKKPWAVLWLLLLNLKKMWHKWRACSYYKLWIVQMTGTWNLFYLFYFIFLKFCNKFSVSSFWK